MEATSEIGSSTQTLELKSIQNVLDAFAHGWNEHDVKIFSKVFSEDADFTNVRGISKSGRLAIEELHSPLFNTIWSTSTLTITGSKTRMIKQDVASVDAWWDLDGLKSPDGSDCPSRKGLLSFIMTKEDNNWLISVMHNMDLPGSNIQKC